MDSLAGATLIIIASLLITTLLTLVYLTVRQMKTKKKIKQEEVNWNISGDIKAKRQVPFIIVAALPVMLMLAYTELNVRPSVKPTLEQQRHSLELSLEHVNMLIKRKESSRKQFLPIL